MVIQFQLLCSSLTLVSFDVVSLFTAIPVDKACSYIRKKLEDDPFLHSRTKLNIDDIVSLLNFVLSHNYFVYKDKMNKQIHDCAMSNPVSLVVANLCMEEIEPRIQLSTPPTSPRDFFNAGRSFNTRQKEQTRNVKMHTKGSNVANHAWSKNHQIDFDNASIIDKANYRHLELKTLILMSWHTAKTVDADNNSCSLDNQRHILLNKH